MTTSVKVDDETKSRLEELQAAIRLETGESVTQQEVLARLVERAYESREEFIASFAPDRVPVGEDVRTAIHAGMMASGTETDEDDIDEILYG